MARFTFGAELYGGVAVPDAGDNNALKVGASVTLTFYDAEAGVAVTDFLLWNSSTSAFDIPATSITTTIDGYPPRFQGPDGLSELWYLAGSTWLLLQAVDAVGPTPSTDWAAITGKPAVIAEGADQGAARASIDAAQDSAFSAYFKTLIGSADLAALLTALGLDDASLETKVLGINETNGFYPDLYGGLDDPLPVAASQGAAYDVLTTGASGPLSGSSVIAESVGGGTTGLTTTASPAALGAGAAAVALVTAYVGTGTAPTPSSFTAMGMTWTPVALPVSVTSNNANSAALYVGTGTGDTTKPVVSFPSAVTGCHIRVAQAVNAVGTVRQASSAQSGTSNPSVSLGSAPTGTGIVFAWAVQSGMTAAMTAGTGYTEIGTQTASTSMRVIGEYAVPGSQTAAVGGSAYPRLLVIVELS